MKVMKTQHHIGIIVVVFAAVFAYTFDPKPDIGGDNCVYYSYASSIAAGNGYRDASVADAPPSNSFPPGYPLLMAPLRLCTDSVAAQKILNGGFLLGAALLLFGLVRSVSGDERLALLAGIVALSNYRVLEFASIMMSETAFLCFSAAILWLALRLSHADGRGWWRDGRFWSLVLLSGYAFQIRTQGITLIAAVALFLLVERRWKHAAAYVAGVYLTTLPWTIRNLLCGVGASRYAEQIFRVNQWRPEAGYVTFGELVERGFETLRMLVTKAIPDSVMPHFPVDYAAGATFAEWIGGILLIVLIVYGFFRLGKAGVLLTAYAVFTAGIICLWSAPSENRYLTTILPLLEIGLLTGIHNLLFVKLPAGLKVRVRTPNPCWLLIPVVLCAAPRIQALHEASRADYPPNYRNFFRLAESVRRNPGARDVVVCSRKPQLFYLFSGCCGCNYRYTQDPDELICGLLDAKADYVVVEQLGYASTVRYLLPAIDAHPEWFRIVEHLPCPDTFLLWFDREAAASKLNR